MNKKDSQSYQALLNEVETLVQEISSGKLDLDDMVAKVEKGYGMIKSMRTRLEEVKGKIETLHADADADADK
jgi:exodeoxyribonuclease VII small subunit